MPLRIEWPGANRLAEQLKVLVRCDCAPLMDRWADALVEGNRRGVLAGLDGYNRPMQPLKYRSGAGKKTSNRRVPMFGTSLHPTTGAGPYATGLHDNLSEAAYKGLTGPRLAPRREASRVIKNLHAAIRNPSDGRWEAVAAWLDVLSNEGEPFLIYHFKGFKAFDRYPVAAYDLRPVRPEDYQFCMNAMKAFAKQQFFGAI